MTVIAWDGKTLAADRQTTLEGGLKCATTKIKKVRGHLVFGCGKTGILAELVQWWVDGADSDKWPAVQRDKDEWEPLSVIHPNGEIWRYERTPHPFRVVGKFYAVGSGRDYALAAMHLGKTAEEAVDVACYFDAGCGMGVDTLTLGDD